MTERRTSLVREKENKMDLVEKYLNEAETRTWRGPSGIGKKEFQKKCKSCKKFYKPNPKMKDDDDTCPKCARY